MPWPQEKIKFQYSDALRGPIIISKTVSIHPSIHLFCIGASCLNGKFDLFREVREACWERTFAMVQEWLLDTKFYKINRSLRGGKIKAFLHKDVF